MGAPLWIKLPLSCATVALIAQGAMAQEAKQEYVPQSERTILIEKPLAGVDGKVISINHFTMPPGHVGARHYHPGPTYIYVLKGSLTTEEDGKPAQTRAAGEVYEEAIGTPHHSSNPSADEANELLIIQVHDEGEPLMYLAE
jgi:quercetin dioxygenase-like cupin family protein